MVIGDIGRPQLHPPHIELLGRFDYNLQRRVDGIDVELSCIVNVYGSVPELHLDPNVVQFAASIGAALDFDVYVLPDEDGK